jgi:ankyrin repeat protein
VIELQQGLTALMMAAKEGHADCLIELIAHGADVDFQDDVSHKRYI